MAGPAHPHAMAPPKPGRTRTAPPQMPSTWWSASRIRTYLLFDATGFVYFLVAFVAILGVQSLRLRDLARRQAETARQERIYRHLAEDSKQRASPSLGPART